MDGIGGTGRHRWHTPRYWAYALRYLWLRIRHRHVVTRGMVFLSRGARVECRRGLGRLELGRAVWIGRGTAIRCHEGFLRIGDDVVFGSWDVVNCYLDVEIGADTLFADGVYVGDFDHRTDDAGRSIRVQGIVKSPVRIGPGSWVGVKATILRGTRIGRGSVVGANAVARGAYPDGAVIVGSPGRVAKIRALDPP